MPGRQGAGILAAVVTTEPVHYERIPMRVSFGFATDVGFGRTTGATLLVLGNGEVPEVDALRQFVAYAEGRTSPYLAQPVTDGRVGCCRDGRRCDPGQESAARGAASWSAPGRCSIPLPLG